MSDHYLASERVESLPQGELHISIVASKKVDTRDSYILRDSFMLLTEVEDAGPWTLRHGLIFIRGLFPYGRGVSAVLPALKDFSHVEVFLDLWESFFKQVLAQAQQDDVELPQDVARTQGSVVFGPYEHLPHGGVEFFDEHWLRKTLLLGVSKSVTPQELNEFSKWLRRPPRAQSPQELLHLLGRPEMAFKHPWQHLFLHRHRESITKKISKTAQKGEVNSYLLNALAALSAMRYNEDHKRYELLGQPLPDYEVRLGDWHPQETLTTESVVAMLDGAGAVNQKLLKNLGAIPLARGSCATA